MDADVIVIGGGFGGLTAAVRASELRLKVLVLEQGETEDYPCNSRYSGGHVQICNDNPVMTTEYLRERIETTTDGFADGELADVFAAEGRRMVEWLRAHGVQFIRVGIAPGRQWVMAPPRRGQPGLDWKGRGPDVTLRNLAKAVRDHGGKVLLGARAHELIMENGQCVGVEIEQQGKAQRLLAHAVVIADGGFQANQTDVRRYVSRVPEKVMQRNAGTGRGDGLRMAESVGAKLVGMENFYGHPLSRDAFSNDQLWPHPFLDSMVVSGIVVDGNAQRFVDEGRGAVFVTNTVARRDDPLDTIVIFDEMVWRGPAADIGAPPMPNPTLKTAGATIHTATSIAELAKLAKLPVETLSRTVRQYNEAVQGRALDRLDPPRTDTRFPTYPIAKPPFYAIPMCAGITYTMGGPAIDAHARVIHKDGHAFDSLFAVGSSSGGLEGGRFSGYVGGLMKAFLLGLRAAEFIAASRPDVKMPAQASSNLASQ